MDEDRALEKKAGRTVPITAYGVEHDPERWPAYEDAGMERVVLSLPSEPADTILPMLDRWAAAF